MSTSTVVPQVVQIKAKKVRGIRYRQSTKYWVEHTHDDISGEYHIIGKKNGMIHLYNQLEGLDIYIDEAMYKEALSGKEITIRSENLDPANLVNTNRI